MTHWTNWGLGVDRGLTEARTQKEGLGTGDLLNHFESIDF